MNATLFRGAADLVVAIHATFVVFVVAGYLLPLLYPITLTRQLQIWLAGAAVIINFFLYVYVVRSRRAGDR